MNHVFKTDLGKRKAYLKTIAKNNRSWPVRIASFWLLMIIAIGILSGVGYVLLSAESTPAPSTIMIFFMMAICFACVPFFVGISVKNSAKYKCAAPYTGMTNGTLILSDSHLEYVFWKASKEAPAAYSSKHTCYQDEDKFVYRFEKRNIKSLKIDKFHICHVSGQGILTVPIWASSNDTIETKTANKLSFVTCFADEECEKTILKWRDA